MMKTALYEHGDRASLIKYALELEDELADTKARHKELQMDYARVLADKITQFLHKPTPSKPVLVDFKKQLADHNE